MRLILTTKKAEEREDAMQRTYREEEDRHRAEDSRRSDVEDERGIWSNALQSILDRGERLPDAIKAADEALDAYRQRFQ